MFTKSSTKAPLAAVALGVAIALGATQARAEQYEYIGPGGHMPILAEAGQEFEDSTYTDRITVDGPGGGLRAGQSARLTVDASAIPVDRLDRVVVVLPWRSIVLADTRLTPTDGGRATVAFSIPGEAEQVRELFIVAEGRRDRDADGVVSRYVTAVRPQ